MEEIIDVLNRGKFLEDINKLLFLLSDRKKGCTFAIDGGWGYGKTYVLEKLEDELRDIVNGNTGDDRYYVFHYNCWKFDYYDEPSVAIISAMLENFSNDNCEKLEGTIKDSWKYAKIVLEGIAGEFFENKIGINIVSAYKEIRKNGNNRYKKRYKFDDMFSFKKTLDSTRKKIREIAQKRTVLLVVDELDRCMPTYAIKVLERLHHMFDEIENVVVILAIDSKQLEHSVKEIYGENIDTERYLKKFIDFSMKLDLGQIQENIINKYDDFFSKFEENEMVKNNIMKLIQLCDIDIRNFDKLIAKLDLIHGMVCDKRCSASMLLFEFIWGLMKFKTSQACVEDISNIGYFNSLYWIPEIDKRTYAGLNNAIGDELILFFKDIKKSVESGREVSSEFGFIEVVKENEIGIAWYILDVIFARTRNFYLEDDNLYIDMIESCNKFDEIGSIIW